MYLIRKIKLLPNAIMGYDRSNPSRNGEYKFLRTLIKKDMIIVEAGAHDGTDAKFMLNLNPDIKIHCFEPASNSFDQLIKKLSDELVQGKVVCNNLGLSNVEKEAELFIYNELDQRNSLHLNRAHIYDPNSLHKEKIKLTTLDNYISENRIPKIDFLKLDVEGHETQAIEGASFLIENKLINYIQFEYNNNWEAAGNNLENVFLKLTKYGYKFYRLAIWGKIPIRNFDRKLENFIHSNYVAILQ